MDPVSFERLGIWLDLFAGILVAPELFGLERLRRVEEFTEASLTWVSELLSKLWKIIWDYYSYKNRLLIHICTIICAGIITWLYVWPSVQVLGVQQAIHAYLDRISGILGLIQSILIPYMPENLRRFLSGLPVLFVLRALLKFTFSYSKEGTDIATRLSNAIRLIMIVCISILLIAIIWPFLVVIALLLPIGILSVFVINTLIGYAVRKLRGEDRLRTILFWWGMVFFIAGHIFELISTFT